MGLKKHLEVQLNPRNNFLDPKFLLVRRWANNTEAILNHHKDEEIDRCYYRSENAALYACGDVVSLEIKSNSR